MHMWGKKFYSESGGDEAEVKELITKTGWVFAIDPDGHADGIR